MQDLFSLKPGLGVGSNMEQIMQLHFQARLHLWRKVLDLIPESRAVGIVWEAAFLAEGEKA